MDLIPIIRKPGQPDAMHRQEQRIKRQTKCTRRDSIT
jgi:hypothetical protein